MVIGGLAMDKYEELEMEVVLFGKEDIVTASACTGSDETAFVLQNG